MKDIRPGQAVPASGQYVQVNSRGVDRGAGLEATLVKGESAPPTDRKSWRWRLVDKTVHQENSTGGNGVPEDGGSSEPLQENGKDHWARPAWMEPDPDNPGMWRKKTL